MAITFQTFESSDIVPAAVRTKTFPAWHDTLSDVDTLDQSTLTAFYTKSTEVGKSTAESNYFWNIYGESPDVNTSAEPQFSIAVGTTASLMLADGTNSWTSSEADLYTYPTYAIYRQIVNTVTNGGSFTNWSYTNETSATVTPGIVYIISIARSRLKDYIEPANTAGHSTWQINLIGSGSILGNNNTRAAVNLTCAPASDSSNQSVLNIIDFTSSLYTTGSTPGDKRPFGSLNKNVLGKFYPDKGLFILDANKLYAAGALCMSPTQSLRIATGVNTCFPSGGLHNFYRSLDSGSFFKARSVEKVQSMNYFVRAKNNQFNYSNNPTWSSGSDNKILAEFYEEQTTYITSVGLYDGTGDNPGQLVAIAKLSKPIQKTPETEALIRVRLDFVWFLAFIPVAYESLKYFIC